MDISSFFKAIEVAHKKRSSFENRGNFYGKKYFFKASMDLVRNLDIFFADFGGL